MIRKFTNLFLAVTLITVYAFTATAQSVGINATGDAPNSSAMLDVSSTTKGFLPPRLTTTEIIAIQNPADGLQVYNTTDGKIYVYVAIAATWKEISFGTGTILEPSFICGQALTDSRDSKSYNTVLIGTQCWMANNLAYLPEVIGPDIYSEIAPCYYVYGYNGTDVPTAKATSNYVIYGVLYNWPAALITCPTGWHLPTDAEWTTLSTFLSGENVAGSKMKEIATTHWTASNSDVTNSSGFTGIPGGLCIPGSFSNQGTYAYFWSATEYSTHYAWRRSLNSNLSTLNRYYFSNKSNGDSVRCLKD
jgi:uncharacterized protein (TIGR02145 family)